MSSPFLRVLVLSLALLAVAAPARAQRLSPATAATADDPRRGPRLEYRRGPPQCLPEGEFRSEVAIAAHDGVDHLHDDSPDVVRVWFEKVPGGFRGTVVYTDATGEADAPVVDTNDNCEVLARWVAGTVSDAIPPIPPPTCPPCPAPACPACPVCPACRGCGNPKRPVPCPLPPKPPPWRMDLSVGLNAYVMMTAFLSANVAPAVGVGGEVRGEHFGVAAELRFVVPSVAYAREPVPGAMSSYPVEFDLSQISGQLVPCARYKYFVGCGVAQIGALVMQSSISSGMAASFGFGPRLGLEVPLGERFAVFGFGEVLFSPAPAVFNFILPDPNYPDEPPANTRWQQSVASGFFGAGVSVKFM